MENPDNRIGNETDDQAAARKEDHIDLAFKSKTGASQVDNRFNYEPMLSGHTHSSDLMTSTIAGRKMNYPIWISSMTGGTEKALKINENLAKICGEYKLGMGLGSCRQLLYDNKRLHEFDVRRFMPESPLFINLGIAQIEELIENEETDRIVNLNNSLAADGLIIHINPLQEWMQPEGDKIKTAPIDLVKKLLELIELPIIVKEVGQGFGIESLKALLALPIEALDLAGYGGTNFSKLELLRSDELRFSCLEPVFKLGHTCEEMVNQINAIASASSNNLACKQIIISGGIRSFLDGYYFINKCSMPAIYAQASGFLKNAMDLEQLRKYVEYQIEGLQMSFALLTLKK